MPRFLRSYPIQRLARPLRRHLERHSTRVASEQVGLLRTEIPAKDRVGDLRSELASLRANRDVDAQRLKDVATGLAAVRASLDEFAAQDDDAESSRPAVEDRLRELTSLVDGFRCSLQLLLGPTGRDLTRLVSDDELGRLFSDMEIISDRERVVVAVHQAYRTLLDVELRCVGRFSGSTPNILARLAAIALLPPPSGEVLETGTRFGVGAVGVTRQLVRIGVEPHLTLVGPFAGNQLPSDRGDDIDVSLTPSTQFVVTSNLALGGVASDRYRLIEGASDSLDVQRLAADRKYGLVVLNGDHSEERVLGELVWVDSIVGADALVVLNDFGDPAWPGVEKALDRYLSRSDAKLRLIGTASTCAFLRAT